MTNSLTEGQAANAAWNEWAASDEGMKCLAGRTDGVYLKNRLSRAFQEGWDAAMRRDTTQRSQD